MSTCTLVLFCENQSGDCNWKTKMKCTCNVSGQWLVANSRSLVLALFPPVLHWWLLCTIYTLARQEYFARYRSTVGAGIENLLWKRVNTWLFLVAEILPFVYFCHYISIRLARSIVLTQIQLNLSKLIMSIWTNQPRTPQVAVWNWPEAEHIQSRGLLTMHASSLGPIFETGFFRHPVASPWSGAAGWFPI